MLILSLQSLLTSLLHFLFTLLLHYSLRLRLLFFLPITFFRLFFPLRIPCFLFPVSSFKSVSLKLLLHNRISIAHITLLIQHHSSLPQSSPFLKSVCRIPFLNESMNLFLALSWFLWIADNCFPLLPLSPLSMFYEFCDFCFLVLFPFLIVFSSHFQNGILILSQTAVLLRHFSSS